MYAGLSRINKYFTPEMTDELNASFRQIDEKIDNYEATPLEPKLSIAFPKITSDYSMINASFKASYLLVLSLQITVDEELDTSSRTQIGTVQLPYTVISQACLTSGFPIRMIIEDGIIYVIGNTIAAGDTINIYEELPLITL